MPGKVFASCGQRPGERGVVDRICQLLTARGLEPYVAVQAQSLHDVSSGIIRNLKDADYYLFVDFRRERLCDCEGSKGFRGSLFTNQEMAIAHVLGFVECIFLKQRDVRLEGIGQFVMANAREFTDADDMLHILEDELDRRQWSPTYSRQLVAIRVSRTPPYDYCDHASIQRRVVSWGVDVENRRTDRAAEHASARLWSYTDPEGKEHESRDRSNLKWGGAQGYERAIWPSSVEDIDALVVQEGEPRAFFLHSAADVNPRRRVIENAEDGDYCLQYRVYSEGFPDLWFHLKLHVTGDIETTTVTLCQPQC